jgi:hypothetical protein
MNPRRLAAAMTMVTGAFFLYRATLLPGLDLGDTASLQSMVASRYIRPRDAYPLYFAIGRAFVWLTGSEPAHALNLASAVQASIACGLTFLVAERLSASVAAAAAAALMFAGSYTFWSQSVIAEVYALHALFTAATIWLLLRWQEQPTTGRLAVFFGVFSLGFGNHLSMILLLPACAGFLLTAAPGGWRSVIHPRIVALAALLAVAGALQYAWNLRTLWLLPDPPAGTVDAIQRLWFDVTKSDWRDAMVLRVPRALFAERFAMYRFDLWQQFGWLGPPLAIGGLVRLATLDSSRALLVGGVYVVNAAFAFTYNVGDAHVFYLPAHLATAVLVAPALAALDQRLSRVHVAASLAALYAALRIYADYPALDRSSDRRPTAVLRAMTAGADEERAILLTDENWQIENGLSYVGRWGIRPESDHAASGVPQDVPSMRAAHVRMPGVLLYAPALIADNLAIGRTVAVTDRARAGLAAAFGPLYSLEPDPSVAPTLLSHLVAGLPRSTRYVICVLEPTGGHTIDRDDLERTLAALGNSTAAPIPQAGYVAVAGLTGQAPSFVLAGDRPFRRSMTIGGTDVRIRMDAWLPSDTIRRMGFGHVIANRRHSLIVERGLSFVAFDGSGQPVLSAYSANVFAREPRFVIREPSPPRRPR